MVRKRSPVKSELQNEPESSTTSIEEVFVTCSTTLKAIVSRYLKRPEDIEDIVQETFVRTYEAKQKSQILNLRAYFYKTARNLSLKHLALHTNKVVDYLGDLGILEVYDSRAPLENQIEAHEQFSIFCEAVRELPLQCRRVFILRKIYGLSHEEIAERLNITVSTTNQHLAKGVARCALYMRERGYLLDSKVRRQDEECDGTA